MTQVRYLQPTAYQLDDNRHDDEGPRRRPGNGTGFGTVDEMIRHRRDGGTVTEEDLRRFGEQGGKLTSQDLLRMQNAGVEFSADYLLDRQGAGEKLSKEELLRFQKGGTDLDADDLARFLAQGGALDGKDILRFQRQGGNLAKDDVLALQKAGVKFTPGDIVQLRMAGVDLAGADVVKLKEGGLELDEKSVLKLAQGSVPFTEADLARLGEQGVQFTNDTEPAFERLGLEAPDSSSIPEDASWEDIAGMIEAGVDIDLEDVAAHLGKHPEIWKTAMLWMHQEGGKPDLDGINWDSRGDVLLLLAHKGADVSGSDLKEINDRFDCFGPKLLTAFETGGYVNYRKEELMVFADSGIRFTPSQLAEFNLDLTSEEYCRLSA